MLRLSEPSDRSPGSVPRPSTKLSDLLIQRLSPEALLELLVSYELVFCPPVPAACFSISALAVACSDNEIIGIGSSPTLPLSTLIAELRSCALEFSSNPQLAGNFFAKYLINRSMDLLN